VHCRSSNPQWSRLTLERTGTLPFPDPATEGGVTCPELSVNSPWFVTLPQCFSVTSCTFLSTTFWVRDQHLRQRYISWSTSMHGSLVLIAYLKRWSEEVCYHALCMRILSFQVVMTYCQERLTIVTPVLKLKFLALKTLPFVQDFLPSHSLQWTRLLVIISSKWESRNGSKKLRGPLSLSLPEIQGIGWDQPGGCLPKADKQITPFPHIDLPDWMQNWPVAGASGSYL
jgi:hypothetical protein